MRLQQRRSASAGDAATTRSENLRFSLRNDRASPVPQRSEGRIPRIRKYIARESFCLRIFTGFNFEPSAGFVHLQSKRRRTVKTNKSEIDCLKFRIAEFRPNSIRS